MDLALNNLQWFTCHETKANETKLLLKCTKEQKESLDK